MLGAFGAMVDGLIANVSDRTGTYTPITGSTISNTAAIETNDRVDVAEEVSLGGGVEGPGKRSGSYSDPTASTALDGRRQHRRSAVRRSRRAIASALRQTQEAVFHALAAADG